MSWLTSLFSSSSTSTPSSAHSTAPTPISGPSRFVHGRTKSKGRAAAAAASALRSTSDAFSLPGGRPYDGQSPSSVSLGVGAFGGEGSRPASPALPTNAFLPNRPGSPNPDMLQDDYSYPPRAPTAVGTGYGHLANPALDAHVRPSMSTGSFVNDIRPSALSRSGSMAPHPHAAYPPLAHTWARLQAFLSNSYPELSDSLNFPTDPATLNELELRLNMPLPSSVRESYLCADGQDIDGGVTDGLFFGLALLPLEDVLREWTFWRAVESDPRTGANPRLLATMASLPPRWCKRAYACRGWLPLVSDRAGNYVGVDLDPGPGGEWGQVIVFGRDFDRKCVLWRGEGEGGWGRWLAAFVDELEAGDTWEMDGGGSASGSEDEIGYDSYYHSASGGGGGDAYGDRGTSMRLAGEYRGWPVMEAWFDRSAQLWDEAGLLTERDDDVFAAGGSSPQQSVQSRADGGAGLGFGDVEASSTSTNTNGKGKGREGLPPINTGAAHSTTGERQLASPLPSQTTSTDLLAPTPVKSKTNFASAADEGAASARLSIQPLPTITMKPPPAPFDLPTRSDVLAAEAVARAEDQNIRGGWIMGAGVLEDPPSSTRSPTSPPANGSSVNAQFAASMVDVDLEGGRQERFGFAAPTSKDDKGEVIGSGPASRATSPVSAAAGGLASAALGFLTSSRSNSNQELPLPVVAGPPSAPGSAVGSRAASPNLPSTLSPTYGHASLAQVAATLPPPPKPASSPILVDQFRNGSSGAVSPIPAEAAALEAKQEEAKKTEDAEAKRKDEVDDDEAAHEEIDLN